MLSRTAGALLLTLAAFACAGGLTLPEPPSASRPRFLGELSGFYALSTMRDGGTFELPVGGSLTVLHVSNPDGQTDPLVASLGHDPAVAPVEGDPLLGDCTEERAGDPSIEVAAVYDDARPKGQITGTTDTLAAFEATRVAGGGLSFKYAACPGAPVFEIHAERTCPFDASMSGVYDARVKPTGGAERATDLALGFRPPIVVGLEWPADGMGAWPLGARFHAGSYDAFRQSGRLNVGTVGPRATRACGRLSLQESAGMLSTAIDLSAAASKRDCVRSVEPAGAVTERLTGTRLSGGAADACEPPRGGLVVDWRVRKCPLRRYLDVRVLSQASGALLDTGASRLELAAIALDGSALPREPDIAGLRLSGRFRLDVRPSHKTYVLYAVAVTGEGWGTALPVCFADD